MPRQNLVSISPYPVGHGKNGGGGGTTIIMGGQGSGNSKNLTVHSINASKGNIDNLRVKSLSANDADILYLMTQEGQIIKLKGDTLNYNAGYIGSLQSDEITAKKLNVDDIEAVNAWIKTLQSESITTEYLTVTKQAHFFELVIDKIRSVGGQLIISPASCVVDWVWGVTNNGYVRPTAENLSEITAFDVFWRSTEDTGRSVDQEFLPLDQVICQSFNNVSTGVNYDVANKYYWRLVDAVYSNYGYVNLTTGAITQNSQAAINNKYNIAMLATQNKDEFDNYYDNEMIWEAAAQTIQGIQTNVQWQDGILQEGQAVNGVFSSSSQVYGMRIFPSEDNKQLNITSKLDFVIKQQVGDGFIIPDKINIGIYFTNDTYLVFNNVAINNEGELTLNLENPNIPGLSEWKLEAPIEEIVIVSTADVNWHLCHRMTISNTDMDDMLSGYASIPSAGDNLVQLGYRGTDDQDRQSAIIISSRPTPDQGGQFDGRTLRPIYPPSYVQYKGIGSKETASENYDLYRFRQSFIDGRGASFVGDISLCTIGGSSIDDTINNIETKSKKILTNASVIQLYTTDNASSPIRLYPSTLDISIMSPNSNGGTDTLTTVPIGYEVDLIYDRPAGSDTTVVYNAGDSLSGITLIVGSQIGEISKLRIFLYKVTGEGQDAQRAMIDNKDLTYMRASTGDAVDGGHTEFRYKNAHFLNAADLPENGSDGFSDAGAKGWSKMVSSPDVANEIWTWQCQCYVTAAGVYGIWEGPIRITGANGKDGEDGTDIEFIYTRNNGQPGNRPNPPAAPVNDAQGNPVKDQDDWHGTDSNGITWTDNPVGVASDVKFEYMAQRFKVPGSSEWSAYTTPCVWSNWGERGMDGDGFEYIFLLSQENDPSEIDRLYNPTPNDWNDMNSDYQSLDEYADYLEAHKPSGMLYWWTDDPDSITSTYPYVYVCKRTKKRNGSNPAIISGVDAEKMVWTQFSTPALWARYASQGSTGAHYEFRYCNFKPHTGQDKPTKPTTGSDGRGYYGSDSSTYGGYWGDAVADPDVNNGEFTFMTQCLYTPVENGTDYYGEWTAPFRITGGNGKDGEDGDSIEFIYKHFTETQTWEATGNENPANWAANQTDDYTGPSGYQWTDNPTGIDTTNKYEYVAQRERINGTWGTFTTPVIWSAYGEKGQDGDGFEYIYKVFSDANKTTEYNTLRAAYNADPTSAYQTHDEYYSYVNWYDDPQSPTEGSPCWCSKRKRTNGLWGEYSEPALWSRWAVAGQSGGHWEMRYCNFKPTSGHETPTKPTDGSDGIDKTYGTGADAATWHKDVSSPDVANGEFTFMTQCFCDGAGVYQDHWTDPFQITGGNGKDGEDGDAIEFIYKHFTGEQTWSNNNNNPAYWAANQTDDYTGPSGYQWTDNPTGVDANYLYEYVSQRKRVNGTWGQFVTPVIWSKWGEKGMDGDGYEYIFQVNNSATAPSAPTNSPQQDDYVPTGWSDDPVSMDASHQYLWVCMRKKHNGTWGSWIGPSLWGHYATAEGGTPGTPGENAVFDYLIPNKEVLTAMVKTAISDGNAVNLYCDLDYDLYHVDGSNISKVNWGSTGYTNYKIQLKAYNRNFTNIWSTYMTSNGTSSGTAQGTYQKDNLLNEVNPSGSYASADYRDYMKCYSNTNSTIANRAPIYLEVTLLNGSTVVDKRVVQVIIETGAVFKVIDDDVNPKITAAVTTTTQDLQGWVNSKNYATQTWTSSEINTKVGQEIDSRNLVTVTQMQSEVSQSSSQILSTVSQTYATKESIEDLPTTKVEMVDLTSSSYDRSKFYPCSISLERNRTGYQRIQVQRYLDSSTFGSGPSQWATHSSSSYGFICELDWNTIGCGWGSSWSIDDYQYGPDYNSNSSKKVYPRFINKYIVNWTKSYNGIPANYVAGNICQNPYSTKGNSNLGWADEIVYLRGGSKYKILTDFESSDISVYSSGYSWSGSGASYSAPVKTYTQFKLDTEDAITRSEIRQTVDEISLSVIEERAATKEELNGVKTDVDALEDDVDGLDTDISGLKTNIQRTGVDITNGKIRLQANKVTFENSAGTVSDKIWIDPTAGTLHAVNGEFTGTLNASVMYTSVFEINKNNATASGGELQYNLVNNTYPLYNSYIVWRHDTDTNEKEVVVILPSATSYKGIEFEFFSPFVARPMGTKNVWIRSSSSIRYLRSSSTSNYNEDRGYLDITTQLIMPYNKMVKIKSMPLSGAWCWVVSSGDKWKTNESCLNPMYNLP